MDKIKEYWNRQPCNIKHSNKEFLTKEYFNEIEKRKYFVESHIPYFAQFEKWRGKKVLEIGCGIGTDAVNFARNGAEYTGVELSEASLEITKKRFKIFGLEGSFFNLDAENLNEISKVGKDFDLIYSFGVIHHSPHPEKILENCYKLLKDGGCIKIMVYAENSWKSFMIKDGYDQYEAQTNCPLALTYTKEEIKFILKSLQYKNIDIFQTHIFPYKVEKYKNYEYELEDWFEKMPKEMFKVLEKNLGWHLCITANK
jgi:SAM-dependent methyltransferase